MKVCRSKITPTDNKIMSIVCCMVCVFAPAVQTKPNIESSSSYLGNDGFEDGAGPGFALVGRVKKHILSWTGWDWLCLLLCTANPPHGAAKAKLSWWKKVQSSVLTWQRWCFYWGGGFSIFWYLTNAKMGTGSSSVPSYFYLHYRCMLPNPADRWV